MDDQQVQFLPFHAINEFMIPEYRQTVLHDVLGSLDKLPGNLRSPLVKQVQKLVQVPGFRNSAQAPLALKVKGSASAFDRSPIFVASVISAWAELHSDLRQQIFDFLTGREWEILPIDADRTKLPGFMTRWPKDQNFEMLDTTFREAYPDTTASDDDINLMIVWLANRLPYDLYEDQQEETES